MRKAILLLFILLSTSIDVSARKSPQTLKLWYKTPADATVDDKTNAWVDDEEWMKSLPIGNGSLGATVFGGVTYERIQLDEETIWSGSPQDSDNPDARRHLDEIRKLLFSGKYKEASQLIYKTQTCKGKGSGNGNGANVPFGCFQTLGDLWIDFSNKATYSDYYRDLDLETAVATVSYVQEGVKFKREVFVSQPNQVMVIRLTADKKSKLSFTCRLTRPECYSTHADIDQLVMRGALPDGKGGTYLNYIVRLKAVNSGGDVKYIGNELKVDHADEVLLLLSASTDYKLEYPTYKGRDYENLTQVAINQAEQMSYSALLKAHIKEYKQYFDRVSLSLYQGMDDEPTDVRLKNVRNGADDPHLSELIFQYGRYLLISSSRPGTMPANLQGIWANKTQTPWNGDYHTDVNIQMNYWPAEVTNLSEMHLPMFDLTESLVKPGSRTAQIHYGAQGWVVHPITNVWGYTSPGESATWGMHTGASGWICQHIAEHYRFTGDKDFIRRMYPVLAGAVRFYLDWLITDPKTGKLVSGPAVSPENTFEAPDCSRSQFCMGPTHDQQVIWQLFDDFELICTELDIDDNLVHQVKAAKARLAETRIGSDGRIMEWAEEFPEVEPGHRHISHLYAVHPGAQINLLQTPQLAEAAGKSMDYRMTHGGGHTGWSAAWLISQYARLCRAQQAKNSLDIVLRRSVKPNLFSQHPPFQMDANFGVTAGIAEMLLQSHVCDANGANVIQLLPALPAEWPNGEYKGLKARGGFEIAVKWKNGHMTEVRVKSLLGKPFKLWYNGDYLPAKTLKAGQTWTYRTV